MPIYKYVCSSCSLTFEEVVSFAKSEQVDCPQCKSTSNRLFPDSVSVKTTLDPKRDTIVSPKEIDKVIGADADAKREIIENRQKKQAQGEFGFDEKYHGAYKSRRDKRRSAGNLKEIDIPKDEDGMYTPLKHLGDENEKKIRMEFADGLAEHRAKRKAEGKSQFDDSDGTHTWNPDEAPKAPKS